MVFGIKEIGKGRYRGVLCGGITAGKHHPCKVSASNKITHFTSKKFTTPYTAVRPEACTVKGKAYC